MRSNSSSPLPGVAAVNGFFRLEALPRTLVSAILALGVYLLITRVINPGFFEPLVPTHSDTWRYFAYSKGDFALADFQAPRPLMLIALKVMGMIDSFPWFMVLVLTPAVMLPVGLLRSAEVVLEERAGWLAQAAYFALCYSLASFYELQSLDFGGCLAGFAACAALLAFRRLALDLNGGTAAVTRFVVPFVLVWISMECKPTYGLVMAALPLFFVRLIGWRRAFLQVAGVVVVVMLVLVKDRLLGSPFVGADSSARAASYHLGGGGVVMLKALWFYIQAMLPAWGWPVVLLALIALWRSRNQWAAAMVPCLAMLAVAPMIAIPNNQLAMYSWFGASLLLLPVAVFAPERLLKERTGTAAITLLFWLLMLTALVAIARSQKDLRFWYGFNQKANAQALKGLETLSARLLPGQRVLIAGPLNAHTLFRNDDFVGLQLGYSVDWTVVVPEQHTVLLPFSDSRRHIASRELGDMTSYDVVALFNEQGRLVHLGPAAKLSGLSKPEVINQLFCRQGAPTDLAREVACLTLLNETAAVHAAQAPVPPPGSTTEPDAPRTVPVQ